MENKKTIGIVGGGQLGRMLIDAAHSLGFKVITLDPTPNSPAAQVADEQLVGSFKDKERILELSRKCDLLTFETESANAEALEELENKGYPVFPSSKILATVKDKFAQKAFLQSHDIPTAEFALIESEEDAEKQGEIFGYPFLLKARFDAYDGRGNFVVNSKDEIPKALAKLNKSPLYAEKFVPFTKELSVVAARGQDGNLVTFPVVETIHKNNICHIVYSPASVADEVKSKAEELARETLNALHSIGVFAVEMFLTQDGKVLVNEIAPRVHNSGHHTIEAFDVSQFEEHIRAITGMPVITPLSTTPAAVMINILGERDGDAEYKNTFENESLPSVFVHIYGKIETRKERKMGHITALGATTAEAEEKAQRMRSNISI